ncbi:MAG: hypothetical protein PHW73_01730 [Atribacterota bacterium]|nr:hypothetical protein [Atribacterota bacterium]
MKEKWQERNYKVVLDFWCKTRIDDASEVKKGDIYIVGLGADSFEIYWGKRKIKKIPINVLDELIEELKSFREEIEFNKNELAAIK